MNWVAFFSQTGSEIVNICERINKWPDLIVSNRQDGFDKINSKLINGKSRILFVEKKPTVQRYREAIRDGSIVTLHGWLRIIPPEICDEYEIYNGHPGLITRWPELKGKDPQNKAFYSRHETAGCVIHEAVAEVDSGKILKEGSVKIKGLPLDQVYSKLHEVSVNLWVEFLTEKFDECN